LKTNPLIYPHKGAVLPNKWRSKEQPAVPKKVLDIQQVNDILDTKISKLRGGIPRYDGAADVSLETLPENDKDHAPPTWEQFYDFIEKSVPSVGQNFQKTINADSANWLFNKPAPLSDRPQLQFERTVEKWRSGKLMTEHYQKASYARAFATLPEFRTRPPDPLANRPGIQSKISWKNAGLITKFLTPGGQLLPRRVTGVNRRSQKKLKTELKKARFLGIVSFTGNPEYNNPNSRPLDEHEEEVEIKLKSQPRNELKLYLENLANGISPTGTLEWDPPKSITNPRQNAKVNRISERGHLPEQREKKKEQLRKWLKENAVLSETVAQRATQPRTVREIRESFEELRGPLEK
jgi:small subunit ribosomal protein S18